MLDHAAYRRGRARSRRPSDRRARQGDPRPASFGLTAWPTGSDRSHESGSRPVLRRQRGATIFAAAEWSVAVCRAIFPRWSCCTAGRPRSARADSPVHVIDVVFEFVVFVVDGAGRVARDGGSAAGVVGSPAVPAESRMPATTTPNLAAYTARRVRSVSRPRHRSCSARAGMGSQGRPRQYRLADQLVSEGAVPALARAGTRSPCRACTSCRRTRRPPSPTRWTRGCGRWAGGAAEHGSHAVAGAAQARGSSSAMRSTDEGQSNCSARARAARRRSRPSP